jgi:DNA-binding transcriptional regulator YhcF (GntR family)
VRQLSDEGLRSFRQAAAEARRLRHEYVGGEHLLLALTGMSDNTAARLLERLGVDTAQVRRTLEGALREGSAEGRAPRALPYTSRMRVAIEAAALEAAELGREGVDGDLLLLGLLAEGKGIAAHVLRAQGITLDGVRAALRPVAAAPPADFRVLIDDSSERSIYEQIVAQVQEGVATGTLRPGERLPTVRQLADELDIAPGTVARAYGELERLGVVVTEGARGTRVADQGRPRVTDAERSGTLVGLLRPVAVAAFHLGASGPELRDALEEAMRDIFGQRGAA